MRTRAVTEAGRDAVAVGGVIGLPRRVHVLYLPALYRACCHIRAFYRNLQGALIRGRNASSFQATEDRGDYERASTSVPPDTILSWEPNLRKRDVISSSSSELCFPYRCLPGLFAAQPNTAQAVEGGSIALLYSAYRTVWFNMLTKPMVAHGREWHGCALPILDHRCACFPNE